MEDFRFSVDCAINTFKGRMSFAVIPRRLASAFRKYICGMIIFAF